MDVNIFMAFGAGVMSFFAPCIVPLLPAYVSYISGVSLADLKEGGDRLYRKRILVSSILYMLGFSLVFVLLGTTAASVSYIFRTNIDWIERVGGLVVMLLALSFMGVIKLPVGIREKRWKVPVWSEKLGQGRAFVVGVVFATAWSPCVGPVLGVILTLAAASATVWKGAVLLWVYSLGVTAPFLVVSLSISRSHKVLMGLLKYTVRINLVTGAFLLVIGFLMFNNSVGLLSRRLTYDGLNAWLYTATIRIKNWFN